MHEPNDKLDPPGNEADLAALLRKVGSRPVPPADAAAEVRAAVAAEWRATVGARRPPQRRFAQPWLAVAASVTAVAIAVGVALPRWNAAGDAVATVARLSGAATIRQGLDGEWRPLTATAAVSVDDEIRTAATGRVALRRLDGVEVRLDAGTRLAFVDDQRAKLATGSVYIDAGAARQDGAAFTVDTPYGAVRHLGTQYVVALHAGNLRVAVREGSVAIDQGHLPVVARAGETLAVGSDGRVERSLQAGFGETWRWAESVAPEFAIAGRSLDEFLAWAARETGRKVVYTSAEAAHEAEQTQLKGSVSGLAPTAAVDAVFASTPSLRHVVAGGQIRVEQTAH